MIILTSSIQKTNTHKISVNVIIFISILTGVAYL